jgi:hypothetical protein
MLLTAVDIGVFQTSADVFAGKGDLDGINHLVGDDIDLLFRNLIGIRDHLGSQSLFYVFHALPIGKDEIEGNEEGTCVFAS